jgi:hypothetical protein
LSCLALNTAASAQESAQGGTWQVSKSSGEVWITTAAVQKAALTAGSSLAVGDNITTGANGRVLLTRGAETILVSPNSSIGIPEKKGELSTTITQRAGTILLEVEKRNVKHFEVETPYLAAVVKGTQFRVSVDGTGTKVNVLRGQVEVADFKSGQYAMVLPGQNARVAANGSSGLKLGGAGKLNPILRGNPRTPSVTPLSPVRASAPAAAGHHATLNGNTNRMRISSALGEVRLDVHRVTHGLAREANAARGASRDTTWASGDNKPGNGVGKSYSDGNNGSGKSAGSYGAGNGNANGGGNGNGNANGNGNGNGNAYAYGNGNGNSGGNGNGKGKSKH